MGNLDNNLEVLFSKMENFVTTKTVVGEQIEMDDMTIIPFMDICLGVGASASDNDSRRERGDGGLGAKITPSAVLIIRKDSGSVELMNLKTQDSLSKIIDMVPGIISKFNFSKKNKSQDQNQNQDQEEQEENEDQEEN